MLTYAILLLIAGIVLVFLEVLLPSGGILAILAAGTLIGSLVMGYKHSSTAGTTILVVMMVAVPVLIVAGFRMLPHTAMGRRLTLTPKPEASAARGTPGVSVEDFGHLLGKTGVAVTPLRPAGTADFGAERVSVIAQGDMIEKDAAVVVVLVEGNSVVVNKTA